MQNYFKLGHHNYTPAPIKAIVGMEDQTYLGLRTYTKCRRPIHRLNVLFLRGENWKFYCIRNSTVCNVAI